jgi:predicted aldo/keto reductase-like oxidoreductase
MIWSASSLEIVKYAPFLEAVAQLKQEGKLRHAGVACHGTQWRDEAVSMDKILLAAVTSGQYDVLLMVYNFLQKEMGERVIKACQKKNIGVTLMKTNPVGNYYRAMERLKPGNNSHDSLRGFYTEYLPRFKAMADASQQFLDKYHLQKPGEIRDAAVKFALSHPGAHTVLGSMDNFETMEAFIRLSGQSLSPPEGKKLSLYKKGAGQFYCRHACGICETHCPHQVSVNTIMRFNYYFEEKNREKYAMEQYASLNSSKANRCYDCPGYCESACPFHVPVRGLLAAAHRNLTLNTAV